MILKGSKQYFYWLPRGAAQKEDRTQEIATLEKEIAALKAFRLKNLRPALTPMEECMALLNDFTSSSMRERDTRNPAPGPIRFPGR